MNGVHIADDELARHTTEIAEAISSMVVDGLLIHRRYSKLKRSLAMFMASRTEDAIS